MMMNHDISNRDTEDFLDKQFLGVIVATDDPRKEGRARVRVFGVHDDIAAEDLPWAYPKSRPIFFGQGGGGGSISVPKVNSVVAIKFDNGNPYSPEYFAIQELAQDVKDELNSEYDGSHVILFDGDQELKIWFTVGKGLTITLKEASINVAPDNLITVTSPNKVVIDSPNIELGKDAVESVIKGTSFKTFFDTHTHPSAGAPPALPMPNALLSKTSKTK
jgi:hypothetical protein